MELIFGVFPLTVVAIVGAVLLSTLVTKGRDPEVRAGLMIAAVLIAAMLVISLSIPHPRFDPANVTDLESMARCGPGGVPVGLPAWLPS